MELEPKYCDIIVKRWEQVGTVHKQGGCAVVMRVLDTFAGIGGFSLGLERCGMETVAFVEIDEYCQRVLAKNWPGVPQYRDIRDVTAERLKADGIIADVITGGFPCQDVSHAGKRAGIDGERSGLWKELARLIGEIRPRYAVLENVSALLGGDSGRWFQRILGDLAEIGYDCEWHCIPASAVGAPHRRDRVWVLAYPQEQSQRSRLRQDKSPVERRRRLGNGRGAVAYPNEPRLERRLGEILSERAREWPVGPSGYPRHDFWVTEPDVGRVANGIPKRVDRLRCLGNAIVPQIAELIGMSLQEAVHDRPD